MVNKALFLIGISLNGTNIFSRKFVREHISDFINDSTWNNFYKSDQFSIPELDSLDSLFQPKVVFVAPMGSLQTKSEHADRSIKYRIDSSETFSMNEIQLASDFTLKSFYGVHSNHYYESDLKRFYSQQSYFFSLPLRALRHFDSRGNMVAFCVLGKIENHPKFNESVWHVGYWGMSPTLSERPDREAVKNSWYNLLSEANQIHKIVSCVDYFNHPAAKMAEKFGLESIGFRLDPRV